MSALVLLPGEGKALQIGGGGLGVVFKLYGTDTGVCVEAIGEQAAAVMTSDSHRDR